MGARLLQNTSMKRIGIFSGTFDPVHRGHVESCVVALGALSLDTVLVLIEKQPRRKQGVADIIDRANMLELAMANYPSLRLVDLDQDNITTKNTLDYLEKHFQDSEYWYIVGSDMLDNIEEWPDFEKLMTKMNLCVVLRDNDQLRQVKEHIEKLRESYKDAKIVILPSVWSPVSSSSAKASLRKGEITSAIDPAVQEYIKRHKLYA